MSRVEASRPRLHLVQEVKQNNVRFLDQYRPTERAKGITSIDFAKYRAMGVTTLLLDAEGTFVRHDGWKVDTDVIDAIKDAGFEHIAIVSNKRPKDERTFVKLNYWAHQIGADIVVTPEVKSDRKPGPAMLEKAMQHFHVRPDQTLMIGDKATADIKAANAAGTYSVQVDRHGNEDMVGDRIFRRPLERGIGWKLRREKRVAERRADAAASQSSDAQIILFPQQQPAQQQDLPAWTKNVDSALLAKSKIVNLGGPRITSIGAEHVTPTTPLERAKDGYEAFMYEHGRTVANTLTWARLGGTLLEVGLLYADKRRAARIVNVLTAATDAEGMFARMHKDGGTKAGADLDQKVDKARSAILSLAHRHTRRTRTIRHAIARIGSDVVMNTVVRPHYEAQGIDTKAGLAGKVATGSVSVAENVAEGPSNPEWVQNAADAAKVGRVPLYIASWEGEVRKRRREHEVYEKAKAELLAA